MTRLVLLPLVPVMALLMAERALSPRWPVLGGGVALYAMGVNLAACWLSMAVLVAVLRASLRPFPVEAGLLAGSTRLLLVAMITLGTMFLGPWPATVVAGWMVAGYLLMLAVETALTIGMAKAHSAGSPGANRT